MKKIDTPTYSYIQTLIIDNTQVNIAVTHSGGLRVGSLSQILRGHATQMPNNKRNINDCWLTLNETAGPPTLVHLKIIEGAIWCNIGKYLATTDNEYPFLFATMIRYLSWVKISDGVREEHDQELEMRVRLSDL